MSSYLDLKGTSQTSFNIGIAATAVKLKSNASVLEIKNKADSAFLDIRALVLKATGDSIILNDDATLAGADWKLTFARPAAGMTASVTYTFPAVPTNGYFLTTDGSGNLSWQPVSSPSVTEKVTVDSTPVTFASFPGTLPMFNLPANAVVHDVKLIIDTAFDAGTLSVGISGNVDKYSLTTDSDLTEASRFVSSPNNIPVGGVEAIEADLLGAPTVGAGRILVFYSIPA